TAVGYYVRKGTIVTATVRVAYPSTANASQAAIGSFPYLVIASAANIFGATATMCTTGSVNGAGILMSENTTTGTLSSLQGVGVTNANMSGNTLIFTVSYESQ